MKAAVITKFGSPEVLKIQDVPAPRPLEGEVLIRVKTIGLNFADVMARVGVYPSIPDPPFIPGLELAGVVETVGRDVRGFKKGDRVVAFTPLGAYAEFVSVKSGLVQKLPRRMSFGEAAAIGVTYLTAYHGLVTLANIQKGEKLLLHAAAGGVGTATVQVAKHLGVEVFGTGGSAEKLDVARHEGLDHAINYRTEDFAAVVVRETGGYGVDVVMDSVGGSVFRKGWKLLAPMGRYVLYGFASVTGERTVNKLKALKELALTPIIFPPSIVSKNLGLFGFNLFFLMHKTEYFRKTARQVFAWYEKGIIKPVIGSTFPFDKIGDAQAFMQSRKSVGKIVVVV